MPVLNVAFVGSEELARSLAKKGDVRDIENMKKGIVTYQPIGVIYGMQPWNFPAYQVFRYAIANLMAGNSVLLKHAANVTGSGLLIEKIFHEIIFSRRSNVSN